MASPQEIANFRYQIHDSLISAKGILHECNDQMNAFLSQKEKLTTPAEYRILMVQKGGGASGDKATQRNIYFRFDLEKNVFYMEKTGGKFNATEDQSAGDEYEVMFFPAAEFISIEDDYVALEKWLVNSQDEPKLKIRDVKSSLENFIVDNDGKTFLSTKTHTPQLVK